MSVWHIYPDLTSSQLRTLVAVTAQVLLESQADGPAVSPDVLQQSTATIAQQLQPMLTSVQPTLTQEQVQEVLEDEGLAVQASRAVLDQVKTYPELADRIAQEYEARQQKMTGIELTLLAGAVVVLAMRIKKLKTGPSGVDLEFEPAGDAVKAFVAGLAKGVFGG